jgi:hypothetical protein
MRKAEVKATLAHSIIVQQLVQLQLGIRCLQGTQ